MLSHIGFVGGLASFLVACGRKAIGEIRYFGDGYEALTSFSLSHERWPRWGSDRGRREMFGANASRKSATPSNLRGDRMVFKVCSKASAKLAARLSPWIAPWALILAATLTTVCEAQAEASVRPL